MGYHPINLAVRFFLEVAALISLGMWGWQVGDGWVRYLLAIGIPMIFAAAWVTFAVPDDRSRSGSAPVVISGIIRLILELGFFSAAFWASMEVGYTRTGWIFAIVVVIHYAISYDRIIWLLSK